MATHTPESPRMICAVMLLAIGTFCLFLAVGYWLSPLFTRCL